MSLASNESSRIGIDDRLIEEATAGLMLLNLMTAIYDESFPVVNVLLRTGDELLDINDRDRKSGDAPIHAACEVGNLKIVRLLVDYGADETQRNRSGATALSRAIAGNHLDVVQFLCRDCDEQSTKESTNEFWQEPLQYAILYTRNGILSWMLQNGADPNMTLPGGKTPVQVICSRVGGGDDDVAARKICFRTLVEHGASLTIHDNNGRYPIHLAQSIGMIEAIINQLGIQVVNQPDAYGWTPLHHACAAVCGNEELCHFLLQAGADLQAKTNDGETPLHLSLQHGGAIAAFLLTQGGHDLSVKDDLGRNPLHLVLTYRRTEKYILHFIKKIFIPLGGDILEPTNAGWTPLHYAVYYNLFQVVTFLLDQGVSIDECNQAGQSPVHLIGTKNFPFEKGQEAIAIQDAIDGNVAPHLESTLVGSFPRPTLHGAYYVRIAQYVSWPAQHEGVLDSLLSRGADCTRTDEQGNLPFFLAAATGWLDASFRMIRLGASQGLFDGAIASASPCATSGTTNAGEES